MEAVGGVHFVSPVQEKRPGGSFNQTGVADITLARPASQLLTNAGGEQLGVRGNGRIESAAFGKMAGVLNAALGKVDHFNMGTGGGLQTGQNRFVGNRLRRRGRMCAGEYRPGSFGSAPDDLAQTGNAAVSGVKEQRLIERPDSVGQNDLGTFKAGLDFGLPDGLLCALGGGKGSLRGQSVIPVAAAGRKIKRMFHVCSSPFVDKVSDGFSSLL